MTLFQDYNRKNIREEIQYIIVYLITLSFNMKFKRKKPCQIKSESRLVYIAVMQLSHI